MSRPTYPSPSQPDSRSDVSSLQNYDAMHEANEKLPGDTANLVLKSGDSNGGGFFARIYNHYSEKALLKRIEDFEMNELKVFVAQKLFKMDGLLRDEQTRLKFIDRMLAEAEAPDEADMDRKYGPTLSAWFRNSLSPSLNGCSSVLKKAIAQLGQMKRYDPLCTWFLESPELSSRVISLIDAFSQDMFSKVRWSLLVEPGTFSCHLTEFLGEFHRLEAMSREGLSPDEVSHGVFDANHVTRARSKVITCLDSSRVVLRDHRGSGQSINDVMERVFGDEVDTDETKGGQMAYGSPDFIHASFVRGGPLLNQFICTQSPLENTQLDFWRMVIQEKCALIVMLCGAVDPETIGSLDSAQPNGFCSYYWPRFMGDSKKFGDITVRNVRVDETTDPLFTITHLEVHVSGERVHVLEHWQWDWQIMTDVHWPFRVLRRARQSSSPTIVHCMDGCARSGTLVAIETVLCHFLKGLPLSTDVVLLSSLFVRLQRRHSIGSPLFYLFIYRCVLHWISPYIPSFHRRFSLGLVAKSWGFVSKYEEMAQLYTTVKPTY